MHTNCPFCEIINNDIQRIIFQNDLAIVLRDGYPISNGHTLIIPKRHVDSYFSITKEERNAIFELVEQTKKYIDNEFKPDAYNIGINDGVEAGQTVPHLHIHLIPRYKGDAENPRGGVRWLFPDKADYWSY